MLSLAKVDKGGGEVATREFKKGTEDEEYQHVGIKEVLESKRMSRREARGCKTANEFHERGCGRCRRGKTPEMHPCVGRRRQGKH